MQTVTLTHGLLIYPADVIDEQSEPFTVIGITLTSAAVPLMTVSVVDPDTFPDIAVIVVLPVDTEVARPLEPEPLLIVATDGVDELQVADSVRF